ncbi:MAG: cytochrome c oxidase subunit II [Chitinophagales bacterium]|nr:MAG: cytochrome c oxidase subunit II [Chitinophagales bacterium]
MITLLFTVAVLLVGVIIFQIARVSEMLSILKGQKEGEVTSDTSRLMAFFLLTFLVLGMVGVYWSAHHYKSHFLPSAASVHGVELDKMFNITLFFTGIVFVITQILTFWFAFRYRGEKGKKSYYYPHNNKLEVVWTSVPAIVMTVLVIFGIRAWFKTTGPAPQDAMEVEAIAEQFQWTIRYAGADGKLGKRSFELISSDNPLGIDWDDPHSKDDFITTEIHLPVNKPVLFRLASKDVLHSFYLPHFRVKMDCVPGIPTRFWFTPTQTSVEKQNELNDPQFTYILACAELCGSAHWNMRRNVIVETPEGFQSWFNQQQPLYNTMKAALEKAGGATETEANSEINSEANGG